MTDLHTETIDEIETEEQDLEQSESQENSADLVEFNEADFHQASDLSTVTQAVNGSEMSARFVIVTRQANENLNGNKVHIKENKHGKGMQLDHHQTAPIVLFEHGHLGGWLSCPIAMARNPNGEYTTKKQANKIVSTAFFSQHNPEAAAIFAMIDEGTLGMASVGFRVKYGFRLKSKQGQEIDESLIDFGRYDLGFDFTESTLMEWSVVARGADPGAIRQTLEKSSLFGQRITEHLRQSLAKYAEKPAVWSPSMEFVKQTIEVPSKAEKTNSETVSEKQNAESDIKEIEISIQTTEPITPAEMAEKIEQELKPKESTPVIEIPQPLTCQAIRERVSDPFKNSLRKILSGS